MQGEAIPRQAHQFGRHPHLQADEAGTRRPAVHRHLLTKLTVPAEFARRDQVCVSDEGGNYNQIAAALERDLTSDVLAGAAFSSGAGSPSPSASPRPVYWDWSPPSPLRREGLGLAIEQQTKIFSQNFFQQRISVAAAARMVPSSCSGRAVTACVSTTFLEFFLLPAVVFFCLNSCTSHSRSQSHGSFLYLNK